jgi:Holliday junction resolvasome RuvABC endonuclease subunit
MSNERVLALDLATKFGFCDSEGLGSVQLARETRHIDFFLWLEERLINYNRGEAATNYEAVVIENAICQMGHANEVFHELKTCVKILCSTYGINLHLMSPTHVKKVFTGNGGAKKDAMIDECLRRGIKVPYTIKKTGVNRGKRKYDEDAADAAAIYFTYWEDKKLVDKE